MNCLIAAVALIGAFTTGVLFPPGFVHDPGWPQRAVTLFSVWLLSFIPGWLCVRFLGLREEALWNEYVLNLYRLRLDDAEFLPPPPVESEYAWLRGATSGGDEHANIYRQKFNAFYGRKSSSGGDQGGGYPVNETYFPLFLCTVTLAVAWTVILWNPVVVMTPIEPWATLQFGFLGAYVFTLLMLVRRFYQSDLRPSAYATVVVRIVVVLVTLAVMHQLLEATGPEATLSFATQYVIAFVVGFFPLVGLQALHRAAAKALHVLVPTMAPEYPLDQLDGLNIWYEARLVEEGVEDMQNLTTVNFVDVMLHTRAPVARLIDWLDQAYLLIHLPPANRKQLRRARNSKRPDQGGASMRLALRGMGIRSATELVHAFGAIAANRAQLTEALSTSGLDPTRVATLVRLLAAEPGLAIVWNWKHGGPTRARRVRRRLEVARPLAA
jgi:hypothetical protein